MATIWDRSLLLPILGLDALVVLVALTDWLFSRADQIQVQRNMRHILSIGQPNPVRLQVTVRGKRRLNLRLNSDLPLEIGCAEQPITMRVKPGVIEEATVHYVPSTRGEFRLGDHYVRFRSRLGLWVRQERIPDSRQVHVYPDLALIRTYELLARQHRQYALVRASVLRGGESEFARLRDYSTDDDYRFIDWKATARRGQLTSREFQLESDQNVFLVLDAGRLMTAEVGGLTQFDLALNSALLMAHVATRGGDRVGMMCFDEDVRAFVMPEGGAKATSKLVKASYAIHPKMVESAFSPALSIFDARMKQRSLVVLFTQLLDDSAVGELSGRIRHLAKKHLLLVVVLEDTDLAESVNRGDPQGLLRSGKGRPLDDLYDRGAAAELLRWKGQAVGQLKRAGALVLETPAHELSNQLINRYLNLKARHAL